MLNIEEVMGKNERQRNILVDNQTIGFMDKEFGLYFCMHTGTLVQALIDDLHKAINLAQGDCPAEQHPILLQKNKIGYIGRNNILYFYTSTRETVPVHIHDVHKIIDIGRKFCVPKWDPRQSHRRFEMMMGSDL